MLPCFHASSITQTRRAFTLSELLISLAVLGLIAALILPSTLNAITGQVEKAVYKETIKDVQDALSSLTLEEGIITNHDTLQSRLATKLNGRICNAAKSGWSQGTGGDLCVKGTGPSYPFPIFSGILLPNGAYVGWLNTQTRWMNAPIGPGGAYTPTLSYYLYSIYIDANVKNVKTIEDVDVIEFRFNPNEFVAFVHGPTPRRRIGPRSLAPLSNTGAATVEALYR